MAIVTVKNKYQVVIPQEIRKHLPVSIGDLLEARVENGKITLTPKALIDRELAEGLQDIRKGRTYGPYESGAEMVRALHRITRSSGGKARRKRR